MSGFWGLPGYVMQGAYAELNQFLSRSVQNYIITSRVVQGERELQMASEGEKADIVNRWKHDAELGAHSQRSAKGQDRGHFRLNSGEGSSFWRSPLSEGRRQLGAALGDSKQQQPGRASERSYSPVRKAADTASVVDTEYEAAIRASVMETSRGDAEEDAMVEAAIRESVKAVRQQGSLPDPVDLVATVKHHDLFEDEDYKITDEEYQNLIEQALRESLSGHAQYPSEAQASSSTQELDAWETAPPAYEGHQRSSGSAHTPTSDEDDDLQRAIEESRKAPPILPPRTSPSQQVEGEDEEEQLRRAIEESRNEMERAQNERTEEDIVMEYVKKQSLAEEEYRKQHLDKGKGKEVADADDDEEELRRAIEESLRLSGEGSSAPREA